MSSSSSSSNSPFDDDEYSFLNTPYPHKNPYDLNNKIMLTAIVSLSLVVLLVIALHIYARFALRRQARRQAAMRRLGILSHLNTNPHEPPRSGLNPLIISSLPIFIYKQNEIHDQDHDHIASSSIECAVCLSSLEDGETARVLINCKHVFHSECIDKWFGSNSTCPICRTEAEPRLLPEPREAPVIEPVCNGGSSSRLSSFRRILSRERSSRRIQPCVRGNRSDENNVVQDLERQ